METNKSRIMLIVAGCLLLFLISVSSYSNARDVPFATDAFYQGTQLGNIDYKSLYDSWYVGLAPGSGSCKTEMEKAVSDMPMENGNVIELCMTPNAQWIAPHVVSSNGEIGADQHTIMPYEDEDVIISPGTLVFLNQNISLNENSEPYIEAILNNSYKIRWDNISCWWCHVGKENKTKHTRCIGKGGSYSQCTQGYIIGEAKADTAVSFFKLDANGDWLDASVGEVLGYF